MDGKLVKLSGPRTFAGKGCVHVDHKNGTPFYVFDNPNGFEFTLPKGTYRISGGTMIGRMEKRKGHRAPSHLRFPLPKKISLHFAPNPVKAAIDLRSGTVVVDPALRALPSFCLTFILFHEIGHYFYKDEAMCDLFAAQEMHRRGFNPSQIAAASTLTLTDAARRRCNFETAKQL